MRRADNQRLGGADMTKYINVDDLKDEILLIALNKNTVSIKEIYNTINKMPVTRLIEKE